MIPTIETIVEGVRDGSISTSQAVTWLHEHASGAANDLRDAFASSALTALIGGRAWGAHGDGELVALWAKSAYGVADAMIAERAK